MHLPAYPLLPGTHYLRPRHVLPGERCVMILQCATWLRKQQNNCGGFMLGITHQGEEKCLRIEFMI